MRKFDAVFLGAGPTAVTIFDHYYRKMGSKEEYILIMEDSCAEGAISKGVKVTNMIVPKYPMIREGNEAMHHEVINNSLASETRLKLIFEREHQSPYIGSSQTGYRYCINNTEYDILNSLHSDFKKADSSSCEHTVSFLQKTLGKQIDRAKLFPYSERIWNVNRFLDIYTSKINLSSILPVKKAEYAGSDNDGIFLDLKHRDGTTETIWTAKVIGCMGLGNIDFEKDIELKEASHSNCLRFNVLKYYKRIDKTGGAFPNQVSSIIIPECGICLTNEQENLQSILFDTNSKSCPVSKFDPSSLDSELSVTREKLIQTYPSLPNSSVKDFMCAMTIDPMALNNEDPGRHFRFIISKSSMKNINYVNLPYFTVIGSAINHLPHTLNDF